MNVFFFKLIALILIVNVFNSNAQSTNILLGSYWNGNVEIFTTLDLTTKTFSDLDTLQGVLYAKQGETTYDAENNRYFCLTNMGITIINAQTGTIIDTIANLIQMKGIEYDQNSNKLLGSYWNGSVEIFTTLDPSSKIFTDLNTLNGVFYLKQGETTFDSNNNRYFCITNLGITVVNAQTGAIVDVIQNPILMKGIEYDQNSTNLFGSYWNGNVEIFTALDLATKTFSDIDTLHGIIAVKQGETTYDAENKRYFNIIMPIYSISAINSQTGTIMDTVSTPILMKGIEYSCPLNNSIYLSFKHTHKSYFYPNPFVYSASLKLNMHVNQGVLYFFNSLGQNVKTINDISGDEIIVHRDNLEHGVYFVFLKEDNKIITTKKIIITD